MDDATRGDAVRRDANRIGDGDSAVGYNVGIPDEAISSAIIGRSVRVIVSIEPFDERRRVLSALSRFRGLDVHSADAIDLNSIITAPSYDYAIVWYQALEKMRDSDATALVRLSRSAKVIVALTSDRMLEAARVLHLADAWLFTDGLLDRLGLLVGLSDSGYTVIPSTIGSDFGLDGLRGQLMENLQEPERDVLNALGQGYTNRDIAARLGMSEPQTKAVVRSILGKMRFRNRTEAAVFMARRYGESLEGHKRRAS